MIIKVIVHIIKKVYINIDIIFIDITYNITINDLCFTILGDKYP